MYKWLGTLKFRLVETCHLYGRLEDKLGEVVERHCDLFLEPRSHIPPLYTGFENLALFREFVKSGENLHVEGLFLGGGGFSRIYPAFIACTMKCTHFYWCCVKPGNFKF